MFINHFRRIFQCVWLILSRVCQCSLKPGDWCSKSTRVLFNRQSRSPFLKMSLKSAWVAGTGVVVVKAWALAPLLTRALLFLGYSTSTPWLVGRLFFCSCWLAWYCGGPGVNNRLHLKGVLFKIFCNLTCPTHKHYFTPYLRSSQDIIRTMWLRISWLVG